MEKQGFSGFPNESIKYIGNISDFIAIDYLSIDPEKINIQNLSREEEWKMINIEYFLRYNI